MVIRCRRCRKISPNESDYCTDCGYPFSKDVDDQARRVFQCRHDEIEKAARRNILIVCALTAVVWIGKLFLQGLIPLFASFALMFYACDVSLRFHRAHSHFSSKIHHESIVVLCIAYGNLVLHVIAIVFGIAFFVL